jgi:hypothetical protein
MTATYPEEVVDSQVMNMPVNEEYDLYIYIYMRGRSCVFADEEKAAAAVLLATTCSFYQNE